MKKEGIKTALVLFAVTIAWGLAPAGATAEESPWTRSFSLGLSLKSGNSDSLTANGAVSGERKTDKDTLRLAAQGNYGMSEIEDDNGDKQDETTAEDAKFNVQYNRSVSERFYWLLASSMEYDDIAGIDYRLTIGPGFGVYLVKNDKATLGVDVGPSYVLQDLKGGAAEGKTALRVTERFDLQLSETAKVWQSVEYLASLENRIEDGRKIDAFKDYQLNAELGAEAALVSALSVRVVVQDKYNNKPTPGRKHNDVALITSLVWTF